MSSRIRSRYTEMNLELNRLDNIAVRATRNLNKVLSIGFAKTQGAVHLKSGSLKKSGKKSSLWWDNAWHGEISYGGVSLGVNNPVTYAIYEKERDQQHDFFTPLKTLHPLYIEAILKSL